MARKKRSDFVFTNHGNIAMLAPNSEAAMSWVNDHLPNLEPWQWFGGSIAVEPRYAEAILNGIVDDGLTVRA